MPGKPVYIPDTSCLLFSKCRRQTRWSKKERSITTFQNTSLTLSENFEVTIFDNIVSSKIKYLTNKIKVNNTILFISKVEYV